MAFTFYNLSYRNAPPETKHRKNRPRNITWFNPPYSQYVKTKDDLLLFKGPVRGAFCALSRQGFRGFDWEFCFNFHLYFERWFLHTFSGLDNFFSFVNFVCMTVFVHFIFRLIFLVDSYRIVINVVSRVVIIYYRLFITCLFI